MVSPSSSVPSSGYAVPSRPERDPPNDALLFRTDQPMLAPEEITACVALTPDSAGVPPLPGRDFLQRMRLDFNMPGDELTLPWET